MGKLLLYFTRMILRTSLLLLLNSTVHISQAQEIAINKIESELKNTFGIEKLKNLNILTDYYYQMEHSRKSIRYGRQAVALGENIFLHSNSTIDSTNNGHLMVAYFQLSKILYEKEDYLDAEENLSKAKSLALQINKTNELTQIESYINNIQQKKESGEIKETFFSKTFGDLNVGEAISDASSDMKLNSAIKSAEMSANKGDFQMAINSYEKAINLLRNKGDSKKIRELQLQIAILLDSLDQHVEAQKMLNNAITEYEINESKLTESVASQTSEKKQLKKDPGLLANRDSLNTEKENLRKLSESYASEKEYDKSLEYLKKYRELTKKMEVDSIQGEVEKARKEDEILLLRQQKQIADLNVQAIEKEKEKQTKLRKFFLIIALLVLCTTIVILYFYFTKRKQHKKLAIAYRDLAKTKNKLEGAEKKIVTLLRQQVSGDVTSALLSNDMDKPGEELFVCIMFVDIRDFTPMAESLSPEELIKYQNNVFGFMIDVVQKNHGNINQLLGDGFMATFGAPVSKGNDCQNAFLASLEILKELKDRNKAGVIRKTKIGIGLHAGYVVTGNVGNEARKQYSVTGNPVIIASRVEQLNKEYKSKLLITEEVYNKLEKPVKINEPFIEVELKGRTHPVRILKMA